MTRIRFSRKVCMVEFTLKGVRFRLSLLFPAMVVIMITLDPTALSLWCVAASMMHETGHFIALLAMDGKPKRISMGIFGVRVEQNPAQRLGYAANCVVSLAGPMVNLVSFGVLSCFTGNEAAALVHLTLGAFNLLPIEPLDGGQALYSLLALRYPEEKAETAVMLISILTLLPLAAAGFYLLIISGYNFTLLAVCGYLCLLLLCKRK